MSSPESDGDPQPLQPARLSLWQRLKLLTGRPRRWYLNHFCKDYVKRQLARRRGECRMCGACCQMGIRCLQLKHDGDGHLVCNKYDGRRSLNCQNFPLDERDLAERNLVAPHVPCGYRFPDAAQQAAAETD